MSKLKKKNKTKVLDTTQHHSQVNSKMNVDLNVKCRTIKLPEENTKENQDDLEFDDEFLDATQKG